MTIPDYTQPAARTVQPPFWCVWAANRTATTYLAEDLMAARIAFGVETWADNGPALFILSDDAAREICSKYGKFFRSEITLDVTGTLETYAP